MKIKKFKHFLCVVPFVVATPFFVTSCGDNKSTSEHTIFYTNDVHGRLFKQNENDKYIGLDKLSTYVKSNEHDLLLDAGDYIQGLPVNNIDKGLTAMNVSNEIGYDFHTVGNHEFDFGIDNLLNVTNAKQDSNNSKFLANNIVWKETKDNHTKGELLYRPYVTTTLNDNTKVGIIGIATPETVSTTKPTNVVDLEFLDPVKETQKNIDELESQGIDIIIALSHLGTRSSKESVSSEELAQQTNGLDLIIDGHSHTALYEPIEVKKENENNNTWIVQTGGNTSSLGKLQFNIDNNTVTNVNSELIKYDNEVWSTVTPDPKVTEIVKNNKDQYDEIAKRQVFTSKHDLSYKGDYSAYTGESNLADFFMDALVWDVATNDYKDPTNQTKIKKPDFAFSNAGGYRADINKGPVSYGMLQTTSPFGNLLSIMELTKSEVQYLFDQAFKESYDKGAFLNYSKEVSVEYDYSTKTFTKLEINGKKLEQFEDNYKFIVCTNDFLRIGGDGYTKLANAKKVLETTDILDSVEKFSKHLESISNQPTYFQESNQNNQQQTPDNGDLNYSWDLYDPSKIVKNDGPRIKITNRPAKNN